MHENMIFVTLLQPFNANENEETVVVSKDF